MSIAFDSEGHEVHSGSMLVTAGSNETATMRVFKISGTHITIKDSNTFKETLMTKDEFRNSAWVLASSRE